MKIRMGIVTNIALIALVGIILGVTGVLSINALKNMSVDLDWLQTKDRDVSKILNAHYAWRQGLMETATTGEKFSGSLDPSTCALGKWINSEAGKGVTDEEVLSLLQKVENSHSYVHKKAKEYVDLMKNGQTEKAKELLDKDILPKTEEVISMLSKMEGRLEVLTSDKSAEILEASGRMGFTIIVLLAAAVGVSIILAVYFEKWIYDKVFWYENILDSIPFPLSTTDMKRSVTFLNKAAENLLGLKRDDVIGKQCCNVWRSNVCNTSDCGMSILRRGKKETCFTYDGKKFKVDVGYLTNSRYERSGLIEVVQDVSGLISINKKGAVLAADISQTSETSNGDSEKIAYGANPFEESSKEQNEFGGQPSAAVSEIAEKTKDSAESAGSPTVQSEIAEKAKDSAECAKNSNDQSEIAGKTKDGAVSSKGSNEQSEVVGQPSAVSEKSEEARNNTDLAESSNEHRIIVGRSSAGLSEKAGKTKDNADPAKRLPASAVRIKESAVSGGQQKGMMSAVGDNNESSKYRHSFKKGK